MQPDNGEPNPKLDPTPLPGRSPTGAVAPFRFEMVVPYRKALSRELFQHNTVRLLLFFALFPLLLGFTLARMRSAPGLEQTAWLLGIYYASIWGVVLHNLIKPPRISWRLTGACILFTIIIGIPLLLLVQQFPPIRLLYAAAGTRQLIPSLIGFIGGVGVLEESCKALSVYFVLLRPNRLHDPLSGAFYGAMSGLGFAISEGVLYSVRYAMGLLTELAARQNGFGDYLLANTIRFVSLPLFHAIWAGIVGYFLGLAAINPSRRKSIVAIGIAIAAVLHGTYNTFSTGLIGIGVMAFSILLFVTYLRESRQIVEALRQAEQQGKSS